MHDLIKYKKAKIYWGVKSGVYESLAMNEQDSLHSLEIDN